jgi:hypothetical protein
VVHKLANSLWGKGETDGNSPTAVMSYYRSLHRA